MMAVAVCAASGGTGHHLRAVPHQVVVDSAAVRGVVFDSLAMRPLAGARIQMVRTDALPASRQFAATSDSVGRFAFVGVPAGRYVIGFFHPMLDTLGIELLDRAIDVNGKALAVTLGTPSAATLVTGFCGARDSIRADSVAPARPTLLLGHVRDVRTATGIDSASVTLSWDEVARGPDGLAIIERQTSVRTRNAGFFAVCGLPREVSATASRGTDASGAVSVHVPTNGFLHLTLEVGGSGRRGRVSGRVVDTAQRPVKTAHVVIGDRAATTREDGSFLLDSVAVGSQSVETRAIGYAPRQDVLGVAEEGPTEFAVTLDRVVALPAVVSSETAAATNLAQYLHEKRVDASGATFVEPTRIAGYESQQSACQLVTAATRLDFCRRSHPFFCEAIFVNGTKTTLRIDDIDPDDIIGVEGFGRAPPARYTGIRNVCPFVIWTRCPGATVPTCGPNPASRPTADRPKRIDGE